MCTYPGCEPCLNITGASIYRPNPTEFIRYLPWFLTSNPDTTTCSQGSAVVTSCVMCVVIVFIHIVEDTQHSTVL